MKAKDPPVPPPPQSDGGITVHNRLHAGHRYQAVMDEVLRVALEGFAGPWDVSIHPVGRQWFRIDVVAPDGATWSLSVPVHEGPGADDLADTVRAACLRRRVKRAGGQRRAGKPAAGSDGDPATKEGTPK
jgi:hypothetical protein